MPKLSQRTRKFSPGKETVSVQVGDAVAEMTKTQRYRFDQLSRTWSAEEEDENPFEKAATPWPSPSLHQRRIKPTVLGSSRSICGALPESMSGPVSVWTASGGHATIRT